MHRTVIPRTQLTVSRLGFGTGSLHHLHLSSQRQRLLSTAFDAGFSHFDCARMYGHGMAERELGHFLKGKRDQVTLGTKLGIPASRLYESIPLAMYAGKAGNAVLGRINASRKHSTQRCYSIDSAKASLKQSLKALRTDWLDILFIHDPRPIDLVNVIELCEWLSTQKQAGTIRYLGLAGNAETCLNIAAASLSTFDILQIEDSLIDQQANQLSDKAWPIQITFGYLRQAAQSKNGLDIQSVLKTALQRNRDGMVIVSTRNCDRLVEMSRIASESN